MDHSDINDDTLLWAKPIAKIKPSIIVFIRLLRRIHPAVGIWQP